MALLIKIFAITLAWTFVQSNNRNDKQFFLQKSAEDGDEVLLVMMWTESKNQISPKCELFVDNDLIKEVLQSINDPSVRTVSEEEMESLLEDCSEVVLIKNQDEIDDKEGEVKRDTSALDEHTEYARSLYSQRRAARPNNKKTATESPTTTAGYDGIPVIFPGTKWCGAGDRAKSYDDLGLHQDTDRCCRAHDLCNDTLAPGETRNKLTNKSPFTKLSCKCDNDFYDCLSKVNSVTSNTIGNMYFNILKRECYQEDYPLTKTCKKWRSPLKITCKEYAKDTNGPIQYQWVRAKKYKKIPFPGPLTVTLPF
nr:venom protein [Lampona murina]